MKVYTLSKRKFDETMSVHRIDDSNVEGMNGEYFISINDTLGTDEVPWFKENHKNVLVVHFDDVVEDTLAVMLDGEEHFVKAISEDQADMIANFIREIPEDAKTVIVHCAAGVSRSGGVASIIAEHFRIEWREFINDNPQIHPNPRVRKYLLNALYGKRDGDDLQQSNMERTES